jgi:hypothetical protein
MARLGIALLLLLLVACARHEAQAAATPPPLLLDERGTTMPFEQAVTHIAFRPYVPSSQVLAYAVLPPLGDLDTDAHRGLGIEYVSRRNAMVLSQWPRQKFTIAFGKPGSSTDACSPVHYATNALAWTTSQNVVMTLQPDGDVTPAGVDDEARRLIRAGACR